MTATLTIVFSLSAFPIVQERIKTLVPETACIVSAQAVAREWLAEHEGWTVLVMRCGRR